MLHQHARVALLLAAFGAAIGLVLADPQPAAAQVSVGFGIAIGGGQGPRIPPGPPQRGSWYRPGRNDFFEYASRNGYVDGYEKGLDDGRDRRAFDLLRHRRYRSADHYYDRRLGPRVTYQNAYRDGFRAGYEAGYREAAQRYRGYNGGYGRYGRDGSWRRPY
ncbi:MAG: hypothetical protein IMZ67_01150 [Acidobacteria bacterium]|nr:hypothetical protein [Acidobacteriota bacterium]